jgi:hypothetical protein
MPASSPQIQLLHPRLPLLARATGLTLVVVFALLRFATMLEPEPACRPAGGRPCAGRAAATRPWGWSGWA